MEDEEDVGPDIVVIGKSTKPTPEPRLAIEFGSGAGAPTNLNDRLPQELRALLVEQTDFDVAGDFSAEQKAAIIKVLKGLADHPRFAAKFAELNAKGADIDVRWATSRDGLGSDYAAVRREGDPNRPIEQGEKILVIINRFPEGEAITFDKFTVAITHEFIHLFGDRALNDELHSTDLDRRTRDDIYRDAHSNALPAQDSFLVAPEYGGHVVGSSGRDVLAGSQYNDVVEPGAGGGIVYTGTGDDAIILTLDGELDIVVDTAGSDRLILPGVDASQVATRWSDDGRDVTVLVDGRSEATIVGANSAGAVEFIELGGVVYSITAFASSTNIAPTQQDKHHEHRGAFYGGSVALASTTDGNGDTLTYRIGSVSGDFFDGGWTIDEATGVLQANFYRDDQRGSQFTFVTVIASDGMTTSEVNMTIRWAYSNELSPEFSMMSEDELGHEGQMYMMQYEALPQFNFIIG